MDRLKQKNRFKIYKAGDKFSDFLKRIDALNLIDYLRDFVVYAENFYSDITKRVNWLLGRLDEKAVLGCSDSAESDSDLRNSEVNIYVNESTHKLTFKVKYSDGTVKSGTVTLS